MKIMIALVPDALTARRAVAISQFLAQLQDSPPLVLDTNPTKKCLPHLSEIHLELPDRVPGLIEALSDNLIQAIDTSQVTRGFLNDMAVYHRTWVCWRARVTHASSHLRVMSAVRTFLDQHATSMSTYMLASQAMDYAYYAGPDYDPHITVSAISSPGSESTQTQLDLIEKNANALAELLPTPWAWQARALVIGKVGNLGRLSKIIKAIPFNA